MGNRQTLSADRLRELVRYDEESGDFFWRVSRGGAVEGAVAGLTHTNGYIRICVDTKRYYAHRLAFLYMTGNWPAEQVDHIDMDRANNAWINLRAATPSENMRNAKVRSHSESGVKGVTANGSGYMAKIAIEGRSKYLGTFRTIAEAQAAYATAANDLHGKFARVA